MVRVRRLAFMGLTMLVLLTQGRLAPAQGSIKGRYHLAAQGMALAPNAGGQEAYALRLASNRWETGLFSNTYITAGDLPLTGAFFDWRFPVCDDRCFWQFFVQTGAGVSTGGPIAQLTWGTVVPLLPIWLPFPAPRFLPALRLDVTTQLIFIQWRAVTWSYPLWAGISVPF